MADTITPVERQCLQFVKEFIEESFKMGTREMEPSRQELKLFMLQKHKQANDILYPMPKQP